MLPLAFFLGSSIVIFFIREGLSDTYRCPYCAQIEVGPQHKLRCFLRSGQQRIMLAPSGDHPREYPDAANQPRPGLSDYENRRDSYRSKIVSSLRAIIVQRAAAAARAKAGLGRHLHVVP